MLITDLHARILTGDAEAAETLCDWLLRELPEQVRLSIPVADREVIGAGIDEALMAYLEAPSRYDPSRGSLAGWLTRCAINRVRDARRSEARRSAHEVALGVDLADMPPVAVEDPEYCPESWVEDHRRRFLSVARTDKERAFMEARLDGSPLVAQAAALGVDHLTPSERRREMTRVWDVLRRRFRWRRAHPAGVARA